MTKKTIIWATLIILAAIWPSQGALGDDQDSVFNLDAFPSRERPVAVFDHDAHLEYPNIQECYVCHHLYEDGKLVEEESSDDMYCIDCHALDESQDGAPRLLMAYHKRCQGCHEQESKGPLTCGECHKK